MMICEGPGCAVDLDPLKAAGKLRSDARCCSGACRAAKSRVLNRGEIPVTIGPCLEFTVPADWPERSRRFWEGVDEITGRVETPTRVSVRERRQDAGARPAAA